MKFKNLRFFSTPVITAFIFVSVTSLLYLLFTTNAGLNYTLQTIDKFLPGKLTVNSVQGSLSSPIILTKIRYQAQDIDITIDKLYLQWQLFELFYGKLFINKLSIDNANVFINPSSKKADNKTDVNLDYLKFLRIKIITLNNININYGSYKLQLNGSFADNWNFRWHLNLLNIKNLMPDIDGSLSFDGRIDGTRFQPRFTVDINRTSLEIANTLKLAIISGTLQAQQTPRGFLANLHIQGNPSFQINATLLLPNPTTKSLLTSEQHIQGEANLTITQLNNFSKINDAVGNLYGHLRAEAKLLGTLKKPQYIAQLQINDAKIIVPQYGINLANIQFKAVTDSHTVQWLGSLRSGNGNLKLTGTTKLAQNNFDTLLNISGDNFTAVNTPHYQIYASPKLTVQYQNKVLAINGDIKIPKANITIGAENEDIIELSNDVVFSNEKSAADSFNIPLTARIQLLLGDAVKINMQGLKTNLNGKLRLQLDSARNIPFAAGQINLTQGRYKYLGQTLEIQPSSRITFTGGPVDDPHLQVQAVKVIQAIPPSSSLNNNFIGGISAPPTWNDTIAITLGARVQGTAKNPQISLFSTPIALSQADILSYLLLGVPSSQISSNNTQLLFTAASSLGGDGNLKQLVKSLQEGIGLDRLAIESTSVLDTNNPNNTSQNTSLVLGKALSPKLFISYSIGFLQPVNTLQINYLLSKRWSLRSTTSSISNSLDLLYKIERN